MRSIIISAVTFGAALLLGTAAGADESIQVGGKVTCKTPEQPSIPVEGDPGHVLFKSRPASAVPPANPRGWFELDDLVKGIGMIHGYELAKYKDGSTGTTSYAGRR
jgi:hypothetical protein